MKKYIKYLFTIFVLTFIMFEFIVIGILKFPSGVFHSSYQSLIQDKYRILLETDEPKIIIVAGSSAAFGIDQQMLEDATGYKIANLGLHAGFGRLFYSELAKANINSGDIVLLGYEDGWHKGFEDVSQELIMSGIDDDIKMYTRIPIDKWPLFIGYIFKYAERKNNYVDATGTYSRESFDSETGQMTRSRDYGMEYNTNMGTIDVSNAQITEGAINYLKSFKQYVEKKGGNIYFISAPKVADSVICDYSEFDRLKDLEEEQIGIPYISNPQDYIFDSKLMSDAIFHCNSEGEEVRTELLINDLKRAGIID